MESYTRLAKAGEALGRSQNDLLRVQETLNKAVVVGGSGGAEAVPPPKF